MRLLKKITFTLALLAAFTAEAQPDAEAKFKIAQGTKMCLGTTLNVIDLSSGADINGDVTYFFGDGNQSTPPNPAPSYTYLATGTFNLRQIAPINGTVTDSTTGNPVGFVGYTLPIRVYPTTALTATYKTCGNGAVYLYITDTRFDVYEVDFGDGTPVANAVHDASGVTEVFHPYALPLSAPYTVNIKGKFTAGTYCSGADINLSVTPISAVAKPDVIFMETITEDAATGQLSVQVINNSPFDYQWDFARSGFAYTNNLGTIASGSNITNLTLDKDNTNPYPTSSPLHATYKLNTRDLSYCIRFAAKTSCGRETLSDEICSVTKFTATAADLQNDLTWKQYTEPNIASVDVLRDGALHTSLGAAASTYNDGPLPCAVVHSYQIKANLSTTSSLGNHYSLGIEKTLTSTSLAVRPALTNVNSTVNGADINITFDAPGGGYTAKSYHLFEAVNGGSFNEVASNAGSPTFFNVSGRNTSANSYCYQVNYKDLCDRSPANGSAITTCPIKLNVGLAEDGTVAINWTEYKPVGGFTYTIEVRDETGTVIKTIPGGSGTSATDLLTSSAGQLYYTMVATNGSVTSTSAMVELQLSPAVYVPDAFSPNGDSQNDFFELKGRFIKEINLSVFNRWGEPVFHSTDMTKQWDGKVNGGDAPVGTYAYTLEVTGQKGEVLKQKGTITLAR